jgi:dephospho-CoA kinase
VRRVARVVGLTGGIGTGKSTVARLLAARGAVVIDADAIVHQLQAPGAPLVDEIVNAFGPDVLDAEGALDRARLADRVFRDPAARARLNAIVHPKVAARMATEIDEARRSGARLVVVDIPLLFETRPRERAGARAGFDATVLVSCTREQQIERTVARDGCSYAEAERRVAAQMPIEDKRALADHVIDNSGAPEATERQVDALWRTLVAPAPADAARSPAR